MSPSSSAEAKKVSKNKLSDLNKEIKDGARQSAIHSQLCDKMLMASGLNEIEIEEDGLVQGASGAEFRKAAHAVASRFV
jgi:hypothetical protein